MHRTNTWYAEGNPEYPSAESRCRKTFRSSRRAKNLCRPVPAPTGTLSSAQFGQIRGAGSTRLMQLALRLTF